MQAMRKHEEMTYQVRGDLRSFYYVAEVTLFTGWFVAAAAFSALGLLGAADLLPALSDGASAPTTRGCASGSGRASRSTPRPPPREDPHDRRPTKGTLPA